MGNKGEAVYLLLLVALVMLGAGCGGAPTTTETTNRAEQTIETTTPTSLASPLDNSEETADTKTVSNQVGSTTTTVVASTVVTPNRELSQAWVDSQVLLSKAGSDDFADASYYDEYLSINPNDVSTPMGALCWAYHELGQSFEKDSIRSMLDYHTVPFLMENYGITDEQIGAPGPEATDKFFDLVLSNLGSVGTFDDENDAISEANTMGFFNDLHEFAGDGTAWQDAVRIIASPGMAVAFAAGEGLPAEVQIYADALVAFAEEHVGKPFDDSAGSDVLNFADIDFPGIDAFIEEAKYNQNCKRAMIADMTGNP